MDIFIDPRFEAVYQQDPLVLVDVGARGGLKRNWSAAERHLRLLGFEPDLHEFSRLVESARGQEKSKAFFHVALHNRRGPISLYVAQDRGLSSIFEPNRAFLDTFPEAERFNTTDVQQVEADSLDNQLRAHNINDVDFIKADTQGSELFVLEGAREALAASAFGVEVEVEFTPVYTNQPLFADVDTYMRDLGYLLFDLRPCYWKRAVGRAAGGARGQIIWADALYLKSVPALRVAVATLPPERQTSKVLRAISVALLYGYYDYALEITRNSGRVLTADERAVIEHSIHQGGERRDPLAKLPGRRQLAGALRRLWKRCRVPNEGWSVSDAGIGNLD